MVEGTRDHAALLKLTLLLITWLQLSALGQLRWALTTESAGTAVTLRNKRTEAKRERHSVRRWSRWPAGRWLIGARGLAVQRIPDEVLQLAPCISYLVLEAFFFAQP